MFTVTYADFQKLCDVNMYYYSSKYKPITIITTLKDILTVEDLNLLLKSFIYQQSFTNQDDLIKTMLEFIQPNESNLLTALSCASYDIVMLLYEMTNIQPRNEHIAPTCINKHNRFEILSMLANHRLSITRDHFDIFLNSLSVRDIRNNPRYARDVEVFISNGVQLTMADVVRLTQLHIAVQEIERFGFVFDDAFVKMCAEVNFYPYELGYTMEILEIACSFPKNIQKVKHIMENSGLTPNMECMRQACRTGCWEMIDFLKTYVTVDESCWWAYQKLNVEALSTGVQDAIYDRMPF